MLFKISLEEIRLISEKSDFNVFIDNILTCYLEGKHIIHIEFSALKYLLVNKRISDRCKSILEYYLSNYSTYNSVIIKIKRYINICESKSGVCQIDKRKQINLLYKEFLDSETIQKVILLVENSNDGELYNNIMKYYAKRNDIESYNFHSTIQTGGGSTIKDEFRLIHNNSSRFCFCILDRDKRTINCKYWGDTAKAVVNFVKSVSSKNLKCDYMILPILEIENLIPMKFNEDRLTNANYQASFNNIRLYIGENPKLLRYIDFKKDTLSDNIFWSTFDCFTNTKIISENDKNILFKSCGGNIVSNFLQLSNEDIFEYIKNDRIVQEIWIRLGRILHDIFIGYRRIIVT